MKATVLKKGVYDKDGNRVPVGTSITVKGDTLPAYLKGKAKAEAKAMPKEAVTNPASE